MTDDPEIIDVEPDGDVVALDVSHERAILVSEQPASAPSDQRTVLTYIVLPVAFLAVTLLGGLRLASADNAFIFIKPALICLVFASVLMIILVRSHLIESADGLARNFQRSRMQRTELCC